MSLKHSTWYVLMEEEVWMGKRQEEKNTVPGNVLDLIPGFASIPPQGHVCELHSRAVVPCSSTSVYAGHAYSLGEVEGVKDRSASEWGLYPL